MAHKNAKPGAYPNADRANLFGTMLLQFYQTEGRLRGQAFNGLRSLVHPKGRKDAAYMELYNVAVKDGTVSDDEMERLVMEMCRVMDDAGTWDYTGVEFLDDLEEVNVDLVSQ